MEKLEKNLTFWEVQQQKGENILFSIQDLDSEGREELEDFVAFCKGNVQKTKDTLS